MPKLNQRRVVVTGLGVVSSLGIGWEEWWKNIIAGKSGISPISLFETSDYDCHSAGEIKDFNFKKFSNKRSLFNLGKASQFAIAASHLALHDAKINADNLKSSSAGIAIGTTMGEPQVMEQIIKHSVKRGGWDVINARALAYPAHAISLNVAQDLNLKENNIIFTNACAAGNYAVGYAYDLIRTKRVDYMLAGGVDALSRIAFTGFHRLFAMAPEKCQPFDRDRKGMMLGEGGAILFMESLDSAEKRNAPIYAEVIGYGLSCDANHITHPDANGVASAITKALKSAHIEPKEIDYISAHGTGTKENDKAECEAYRKIFGDRLNTIPVSSIKSMLGHTMGAASAFESIACSLALKTGILPPTINFECPDPECEIDCVPLRGRVYKQVFHILNNSQAFGGNNASLILKRIK